jgi:hypothetical protein
MVTSVTNMTKGRTQKLPKKFKIIETYWHDPSLERSWGAPYDGTISFSFSIQPFSGRKKISQKTSVLNKELNGINCMSSKMIQSDKIPC